MADNWHGHSDSQINGGGVMQQKQAATQKSIGGLGKAAAGAISGAKGGGGITGALKGVIGKIGS